MARASRVLRSASVAWLLTLAAVSRAQRVRGPPQINPEEATDLVVVKLGDPVKLTCPVSSASHLLVDWTKDGQKVDGIRWPLIRFGPRHLRVKSATAELGGTYGCKGITGYGTVQHQIKLVVIDPADDQFMSQSVGETSGNEYPSLSSRRFNVSPPKITQVFPSQSPVHKIAGGRVRFQCVATGVPKPDVKWFKDGTAFRRPELTASGRLTLSQLTSADSGTYECRFTSLLGQDAARFQLDVQEPYEQKPRIVGDGPQNTTVDAGERVSLQCQFNGQPPMHVKWLKRIDSGDSQALQNSTRTIEVLNGDRYHVLNASDTLSSGPDHYMIKLTLARARRRDSGQYVCLGANNGGFTVRTAYLAVRGVQPDPFTARPSSHVYLMIIAPVAIVVVLSLTAIGCLCQRRKHPQLPGELKSDAEASLMGTRIVTHLPADKERSELISGPETSRGVPLSCSALSHHERRYDPPPPHPTPAPSDHAYMLAPVDSWSSRRSDQSHSLGDRSCCSCSSSTEPRDVHTHHHHHLHYVC
ncbi:fibroblast growth factor receptor-like 1 [Pollicipes pollicipes]|uniref:fibroblast growth factor receptor-like 1 n=1 Tax=Pollicipes pollicipes TaxID=41117 RepID=UPI0018858437|nr:fibroblast growth factor receptor-like 1 [Pollicipes pollicipes]